MKSLLIVTVGMLLTTLAVASPAPGEPQAAYVRFENMIKVYYKSPIPDNVTVAIYDGEHNKVFSETLRNVTGFLRPYNINFLPGRGYYVRIFRGNREVKNVFDGVATVRNKVDNPRFAHVTKLSDGKGRYMLSVPDRGVDQLRLRIFNEDNRVVHQSALNICNDAALVLNLSDLKGEYTLEVSTKDKIKNTFTLISQ